MELAETKMVKYGTKMLGTEIIAKTLKSVGVKRVYLFPGGTIAPLLLYPIPDTPKN